MENNILIIVLLIGYAVLLLSWGIMYFRNGQLRRANATLHDKIIARDQLQRSYDTLMTRLELSPGQIMIWQSFMLEEGEKIVEMMEHKDLDDD